MMVLRVPLRLPGMALLLVAAGLACGEQASPESDTLRVMTYNVLRGGTALGQPLEQTAKVIRAADSGFASSSAIRRLVFDFQPAAGPP